MTAVKLYEAPAEQNLQNDPEGNALPSLRTREDAGTSLARLRLHGEVLDVIISVREDSNAAAHLCLSSHSDSIARRVRGSFRGENVLIYQSCGSSEQNLGPETSDATSDLQITSLLREELLPSLVRRFL